MRFSPLLGLFPPYCAENTVFFSYFVCIRRVSQGVFRRGGHYTEYAPIHLRHVYSSRVVAGRSLQVKYVQNTNTNTIQIHRAIHVFSVLVCIFQRKCQLHGGQNGGFQVLRTRHELEQYKQYKGRYNGADYANTKQIRSKYGPSCALPIQPKYHAQYQHNT